ncbi:MULTISPECIES: hypothetical protein [Saccharothrix]|uniref:hypothetical protein n=1 Tax=Saccharothrix TaxID=2071 RepID=UPI00096047AB|nr:hypothetical protein [Saccharothrix sp. CB00851]OKI30499.1 hypothetical protein A6A25_28640 [Saccharothrix sp. CB00851]
MPGIRIRRRPADRSRLSRLRAGQHRRGDVRRPARSWTWLELAALLLTGVPIAMVVLKTLLFADFDARLIRVLGRHIDFAAVAFSAFSPTFMVLPAFAFIALYAVVPKTTKGRVVRGALFTVVLLSCALLPLLLAGMMVLGVAATWLQVRNMREAHGFSRRTVTTILAVPLIAGTLAINLYGVQFWLPTEAVERTDGTRLVGYVVESGDHDLTFIAHDTRRPEILRQDSVRARTLCTLTDVRPGTIGHALTTPAYKLAIHRRPNPPLLPRC